MKGIPELRLQLRQGQGRGRVLLPPRPCPLSGFAASLAVCRTLRRLGKGRRSRAGGRPDEVSAEVMWALSQMLVDRHHSRLVTWPSTRDVAIVEAKGIKGRLQ